MSDNKPSSAKEGDELNKYFFELEKQLTTLDAGMILFLSTLATGFIGNTPTLGYLLLAFLFLIGSMVFSILSKEIQKTIDRSRRRPSLHNDYPEK